MTPEAIFTPLPEVSPSIRLGVTRIWIGCTTPRSPKVRTRLPAPYPTGPIPPDWTVTDSGLIVKA